ncbi:unnamed protein product [Peniophora sp. CBMAI 1063]|nr:unnamed protein product [Peniophora sp. CBMAI 1063]
MSTPRSPFTIPEALTISFDAVQAPTFGRATKSLTALKAVGDGSFGSVWLCDWHSELSFPIELTAPSAGPGSRPEYQGKRVVAVKRMKRQWRGDEGDWRTLREIQALRSIPRHANIVPLLDAFVDPDGHELYLVFEALEGHLLQLIKARRGRPLADGLLASIFVQLTRGIAHIHASGYMHRDLIPENIMLTTFGLHEYPGFYDADDAEARDVLLVLKIADFGQVRGSRGVQTYTEYVGERWYRAPEVLLKSRRYTTAVDMWALGCIVVELLNLRPLFPGKSEYDMMEKLVHALGDPATDFSADTELAGGGQWAEGVELGLQVGYIFPQGSPPQPIRDLVGLSYTRASLTDCISALLRWDPGARLTGAECLFHPYFIRASAYVDALPSAPV